MTLLAKYAVNIRALVTGRALTVGFLGRFGRFANLTHARPKLRLSFLTERFGSHAPYWQFVVWARQFVLALDVWIANTVIDEDVKTSTICTPRGGGGGADDGGDANDANTTAGRRLQYASFDVGDGTGGDGTGGDGSGGGEFGSGDAFVMDGDGECLPLSASSQSAIWAHVAVAMGVVVVFGALHWRRQPYPFRWQNDIETFLFAANGALVGLGTLYTALKVNGDANGGLEVLCCLLLLGSLGGTAAYLVVKGRQEHLRRRRSAAPPQPPPCAVPSDESSDDVLDSSYGGRQRRSSAEKAVQCAALDLSANSARAVQSGGDAARQWKRAMEQFRLPTCSSVVASARASRASASPRSARSPRGDPRSSGETTTTAASNGNGTTPRSPASRPTRTSQRGSRVLSRRGSRGRVVDEAAAGLRRGPSSDELPADADDDDITAGVALTRLAACHGAADERGGGVEAEVEADVAPWRATSSSCSRRMVWAWVWWAATARRAPPSASPVVVVVVVAVAAAFRAATARAPP